jgi:DNA-directed RNA polymerase subunit RPC12/RpoP
MEGREEREPHACAICGKKLDDEMNACPRCGNVIRKKSEGG